MADINVKDFFTGLFRLPGTILGGLLDLTVGRESFVSIVLERLRDLGVGIAELANAHKNTISGAWWLSLAAAGGAALTLFLWPAALTAVAGFSVLGFSIAGVVGANALLQIGVAASLVAAATSVSTYFVAAVVNVCKAVAQALRSTTKKPRDEVPESEQDNIDQMSALGATTRTPSAPHPEPTLANALFAPYTEEVRTAAATAPAPDASSYTA